MSQVLRVGVAGAAGKVGRAICDGVEAAEDLVLGGRADPALDTPLAAILADCDVVVDFTRPDTALENAIACVEAGVHVVIGTTGFDPAPLARAPRPGQRVPGPELRDRRDLDDALRDRGLQVDGQGRDHRAAPRRQARQAVGHGQADGRADGGRRADPLGPAARPGRPPGGHPRRRRPDADDPPRLHRPHVVRAGRAAGGAPRRRPERAAGRSAWSSCSSATRDPARDRRRRPGARRAGGPRVALGLRRHRRRAGHDHGRGARGALDVRVPRARSSPRSRAASSASCRSARTATTRRSAGCADSDVEPAAQGAGSARRSTTTPSRGCGRRASPRPSSGSSTPTATRAASTSAAAGPPTARRGTSAEAPELRYRQTLAP